MTIGILYRINDMMEELKKSLGGAMYNEIVDAANHAAATGDYSKLIETIEEYVTFIEAVMPGLSQDLAPYQKGVKEMIREVDQYFPGSKKAIKDSGAIPDEYLPN